MTPNSTEDRDLIRSACEYLWANPDGTWEEVAKHINRDRKTLWKMRQTEAWEIIHREVGNANLPRLAPAAFNGLLKAWKKGNSSGALETLRSLGFLRDERIEIDRTMTPEEMISLRDRVEQRMDTADR